VPTSSAIDKLALRAGAVLARVEALSGAYGTDLTALHDRLRHFAPELAGFALVRASDRFDRIAVATLLPMHGDALPRLLDLAGELDGSLPGRLRELFTSETEQVQVELESVPGRNDVVAISVLGLGRRSLDTDLQRLASQAGMSVDATQELAEVAHMLGEKRLRGLAIRVDPGAAARYRLWFSHDNRDAGDREDTLARLTDVAEQVGATRPQRNLLGSVHGLLTEGEDSHAWLEVADGRLVRGLGIVWTGADWELVVRLMIGFHPGSDVGKRLGDLAGATDAGVAAAVELVLGPSEPPRMSVATKLTRGRS
jgi:hypothetical protein